MARIDYSQVPKTYGPAKRDKWEKHTTIWTPERCRDIDLTTEKWIDVNYLNTHRTFTPGSKALVGKRLSTGRWVVIRIMEAVKSAT